MTRIALLFLCCCLSCSHKPKEEKQTTQPNAKAVKEVNTTPKIEISKEETIKTETKKPQIKLDYSLKAEELKTLKDSANYLEHYFNQFADSKDSLSEILFFKMFPNKFRDFYKLYGYINTDDVSSRLPLHQEPSSLYGTIYKFYEPINVPKEDYFKKFVDIAINGKWEADNISMFQTTLHKKWNSDFVLFDKILRTKTDKEIESFWVFFFDGPHLDQYSSRFKRYNAILEQLKTIDPDMIPLVEQAYAFVKEDWGDHGH